MSEDNIREKSQEFLQNSLASHGTNGNVTDVAQSLEQAIYDLHNTDSGNAYRNSIRQKGAALRQEHNSGLAKKLLNGGISADEFAGMDSNDLSSSERQKANEKIAHQNLQESLGPQVEPPNIAISEDDQDAEAQMKMNGTTAHPELDTVV